MSEQPHHGDNAEVAGLRVATAVRDLTNRLLAADTFDAAMEALLAATMALQGADKGAVQWLDDDDDTPRTVTQRGFSGEYVKRYLESDDSPLRALPQDQVLIHDVLAVGEFEAWGEAARIGGYRGVQITPLTAGDGKVIGALSTYFRQPRRLTRAVQELTALYARQATLVLERGRARGAADATFHTAFRLNDDFIATLSHELRTPLSAVLMWAKMLRSGTLGPQQTAEGLKVVEASAMVQTRLIDDLLDASRMATGKMRIVLADTDLAATVTSAVEALEPTAAAKGVTLRTELDPQLGVGTVDAERIRQVVWNLINNAVKFTPAGGQVSVGAARQRDEVDIRVSDTGEGIDPALLPHIFDRFRQADPARPRLKGLGLGLAISKQLVELHGGTIRADSEGPGRGATFVVRLPLPRVRPAPCGDDDAAVLNYPLLQGKRVLVVEDEPATREVLWAVLKMAGADVAPADSAEQAIEAFKQKRPDIILSDIGLPGINGHELLKHLHELSGRPRVPAVALTAYTQEADRQRAFDAGFAGFIHKPVGPQQLLDELIRVLMRRG